MTLNKALKDVLKIWDDICINGFQMENQYNFESAMDRLAGAYHEEQKKLKKSNSKRRKEYHEAKETEQWVKDNI